MQSFWRALFVLFPAMTCACSGASSSRNVFDAAVDSATDSRLTDVAPPPDAGRPIDAASPADAAPTEADPMTWTLTSGSNTLWNGPSSTHTWSGPVTPGAQADANWQYELNGAMPMSGYCVPNSLTPMSCPAPVNQVVLTGTSSAGPFQSESDLFNCFLPM